jgi:cobalt-zinc-cadmium resistance protein CzcA
MSEIPGVTDLQIEQVSGVPQLQLKLDRQKLARYGLNVEQVSELVEVALNGKVATELIETQKRYEIFVRYQETFRDDEEKIRNLLIETPAGFLIPVSEVAEIHEIANPAVIRRENALRHGVVQCNVSDRDMGSVVREIKAKLADLDLPEGYFTMFGGTYENQIRAMRQLTIVVILTIFIVFSLLVIDFRSIKQALLIIINIPLALSGGVDYHQYTAGVVRRYDCIVHHGAYPVGAVHRRFYRIDRYRRSGRYCIGKSHQQLPQKRHDCQRSDFQSGHK